MLMMMIRLTIRLMSLQIIAIVMLIITIIDTLIDIVSLVFKMFHLRSSRWLHLPKIDCWLTELWPSTDTILERQALHWLQYGPAREGIIIDTVD